MDEQLEHESTENAGDDPGWPVGFMIMVGLAGLYLVVRLFQMGGQFIEWLF